MLENSIKEFRETQKAAFQPHLVSVRLGDVTYVRLMEIRKWIEPTWNEMGLHASMSDAVEFCIFQAFRAANESIEGWAK
jgi:hypothetical protein